MPSTSTLRTPLVCRQVAGLLHWFNMALEYDDCSTREAGGPGYAFLFAFDRLGIKLASSIGKGKTMVELFSPAITLSDER